MDSALLTPGIRRTVQEIARRELATAALLFVAGHRPLGWVGAQALYLSAPVADLLGLAVWTEWANLLDQPDGLSLIEELLQAAATGAADNCP